MTAFLLVGMAITGGVVVVYSYLNLLKAQAEIEAKQDRLPKITRLESNLTATERDGEQVQLKELRGKVLLAGHVYTRCPRGCAGLAEIMRTFHQKFGSDPNFHLLSFTVDPEHDGPAQLKKFTDFHKIDGDNWWFLTDKENPQAIRDYLTEQFRFRPVQDIPVEERMNEYDLFSHDMRLALVDHEGNVRWYYDVLNAKFGEDQVSKLKSDLGKLIEESKKGREHGMSPVFIYVIFGIVILFVASAIIFRTLGKRGGEPGGTEA